MLSVNVFMRLIAISGAFILAACSSQSDSPHVGLEIPKNIREARNVNQQAITAIVIVGDRRIALTRDGNRFVGSISIDSGTQLSYVLEISEQVGRDSIVLAQMTGTRQITNDTAINLFRNQYSYPDTDSDGFNNLAEREAGSDYANSISTPNNIDGNDNSESTPGVIQFLTDSYSVTEESGTLQLSVTRTAGSNGTVAVSYRLSNETAFAGQDFADNSGNLVWLDGDSNTKTINISVFSDTDFEGDQTFGVNLYAASGGAAIGNGFARVTVQDSTPAPLRGTLQISTSFIEVEERARQVSVLIERVGGSDGLVTVDYRTTDGTAIGGEDYFGITEPRTLAWSDGDSEPKRITISINEDNLTEATETFHLSLQSIRGGATLGGSETEFRIIDTTVAQPRFGVITLESPDIAVTEGDTATIIVQRRNGADRVVSVQYTANPGTANSQDFSADAGTLTWQDGDSADKAILIPTYADMILEDTESFTVDLSGNTGGAGLSQPVTRVSISDATTANFGTLMFTSPAGAVDEGQSLIIEVTRAGIPNSSLSVDVAFDESFTDRIEISSVATLYWDASETGTKSFTVSALSNTITNDTSSIVIALNPSTAMPVVSGSYSLSVIDTSRPGFIDPLNSDGEWEVCLTPYTTTDASAFSTQPSALTGATVTCIKACPEGAIADTTFAGWGWNATNQHSCTFTDTAPGTIAKVPVYLPQRETFTLALSRDVFIGDNILWSCLTEDRTNSATPFTVDAASNLWLRFMDNGTYSFANTEDVPAAFTSSALWSVTERFLSLGHSGELFRNVKINESTETFFLYRRSDSRLRCVVASSGSE